MKALVFPSDSLARLRRSLMAHGPNEAAAIILAGRCMSGASGYLLARECFDVPQAAYTVQEPLRLGIKPEFLAPLLKRARNEGWSLIFAHSHPFDGPVRFSDADDEGEQLLMPSVFARASGRPHATLVLGPVGFDARIWTETSSVEPVACLNEIGQEVRSHSRITLNHSVPPEDDRNVRAFGAEGQAKIAALKVGVVGLGGTGSLVVEELAHLGVGCLVLLDPDRIEKTNLNRVVGANPNSVGRPKVDVAAQHVKRIRPSTQVEAVEGNVLLAHDAARLLETDFIFCCTDSQGSRAVLNQLAYQYMRPTVDMGLRIQVSHGKVSDISGRVQMLAPGLPCLVCQNLLDPEEVRRDLLTDEEREHDPYIVGASEPQPAVISLNATIASMGVTMMLSAVAGLPSAARHQMFLAHRGVVRAVDSACDQECVVCSLRGALGRGDLWDMPWRR